MISKVCRLSYVALNNCKMAIESNATNYTEKQGSIKNSIIVFTLVCNLFLQYHYFYSITIIIMAIYNNA